MKSHVSLEQNVCPVCGNVFDTNSILLDRRLRQSMESRTVTGWSLCPEHEKLYADGYVALVAVDEKQSGFPMAPDNVYRTGAIMHVRGEALKQIVNVPIEKSPGVLHPFMFVQAEVIDKIQAMFAA